MTGHDSGDDPDAPVRFTAGEGGWTYVWDHRRKPHVHPLTSPSGVTLTRVEPPDHPWQRGLWFVVKHVDGDNFWEEYDPAGWGVQRHDHRPAVTGSEPRSGRMASDPVRPGTVEGELAWIRPDRETVAVREHRLLRHVPLGEDAYAIDWDVTLAAPVDAVLDRTPWNGTWGGYSGLALRGRDEWRTRLLLDDGAERDRVTPQPSRWCDLSGTADGREVGVCILDHPGNPSHPVPFYAATRAGEGYGDGWANTVYPAFLWHGARPLPAAEPLRFRYRVAVHDGAWDAERCATAWHAWATGE